MTCSVQAAAILSLWKGQVWLRFPDVHKIDSSLLNLVDVLNTFYTLEECEERALPSQ